MLVDTCVGIVLFRSVNVVAFSHWDTATGQFVSTFVSVWHCVTDVSGKGFSDLIELKVAGWYSFLTTCVGVSKVGSHFGKIFGVSRIGTHSWGVFGTVILENVPHCSHMRGMLSGLMFL